MEVNGDKVEPGAKLCNVKLQNIDLEGADLKRADLTYADLYMNRSSVDPSGFRTNGST